MAFSVGRTRRVAPVRAVFYGPGGIGKSTLAAQAPGAIFLASEEGLENIDAEAVEPSPRTWEETLEALDYVATLNHETLAVDSLDWLEPLVWEYVCRKAKKPDIESFGYGRGYVAALDQWRVFVHKLSALRAKGMNVLLIAHAIRKPFRNPMGDDYEHWTIKLHAAAAGLIVEWCDVVGFISQDVATEDTSGRTKAQTTGKRIMRTHPDPAYLAKTRFAMPQRIVLPRDGAWAAFARAMRDGDVAQIRQLSDTLEERIKLVGDAELEKKARSFVKTNGRTVSVLTEAIQTLDHYLAERKAS